MALYCPSNGLNWYALPGIIMDVDGMVFWITKGWLIISGSVTTLKLDGELDFLV